MTCANHPGRQANNLCMSCGNWYCNSCMDLLHNPPICSNCKSERKTESNSPPVGMKNNGYFLNGLYRSSDKLKTLIKAGLCVIFAIILGFTILFQLGGFSFLFEINFFILRYLPAFIALLAVICAFIFLKKKAPEEKMIIEIITPAQIETLLNTDNRLTASRLAKATNVSEEYAKKFLDDMVVEGKLTTSTNDSYQLVYSRNQLI